MALAQTLDGYIWAGTYEGLARYNGRTFTVFNRHNTPALKSNMIHNLHAAPDSSLWIFTSEGLVQYKNGIFSLRLVWNRVYNSGGSIGFTSDSAVWVIGDRLQSIHRNRTRTWTRADGLLSDTVLTVHSLSDGGLLVQTANGCNLIRNGVVSTWTAFADAGRLLGEVLTVRKDTSSRKRDEIWFRNATTLTRYNPNAATAQQMTDTLDIRPQGMRFGQSPSALVDAAGTLWLQTQKGISRYANGQWKHNLDGEAPVMYIFRAMMEDREGSIWFGTNRGLWRISDGKCTVFRASEGVRGEYVRTLTLGTPSANSRIGAYSIWAGTDKGLNHYESATGKWSHVAADSSALGSGEILSLHEDRKGTLWIGRKKGFFSLTNGKLRAYTRQDGLSSEYIRTLLSDRDGTLWIGTQNVGLTKYVNGTFTDYTVKDGIASEYVIGLYEDSRGVLWIATDAGLSIFEKNSPSAKPQIYKKEHGFCSGKTFTFYEESAAAKNGSTTMWIGTNQGLFRWKNGVFRAITAAEGLFDENLFQLLADERGNLWMSSNKGVAYARLKDLNAVADGTRKNIECTVFTRADGMSNSQCNGATQPAGCKAPDGTLWFPTAQGITVFDPQNIPSNTLPPPIVMEACLADNAEIPMYSGDLLIPPGTKRVEFRFAALSLIAPERVRYKFYLQGFDQTWHDADNRTSAFFTNLSPGEYTLHVAACNNDGVWNQNGLSVKVVIQPMFYQTSWFVIASVLALGAGLWSIYRFRVQYLTKRQQELEQTVRERTADIARQKDVLEEQAREIELANTELQEKNIYIEREHLLLEQERERSEALLLNVLPASIAQRLKSGERTIADKFDSVTVLFSDIVGFTKLSVHISPQELVAMLDSVFTRCDTLAAEFGLEKIKTIGDAYMVVGGIPERSKDHCERMASMALQMVAMLREFNLQHGASLNVRIGMHTGPVVAGVIGTSKFSYDLWGDTVNTASRMESHGEAGKIHVTEEVYEVLKNKFLFAERGEMDIKGKGVMRTWFLLAEKTV